MGNHRGVADAGAAGVAREGVASEIDPVLGGDARPPAGDGLADAGDDPAISRVDRRRDPYLGPFWEGGVHISDHFEELHRWLGISRDLFDDAVAWNEAYATHPGVPDAAWERTHHREAVTLVRRLRAEVRPGIDVAEPRVEVRERGPRVLRLSRTRVVAAQAVEVDGWHRRSRGAQTLRRLPADLVRRIGAWQEHAALTEGSEPTREDEGRAIARALEEALGPGYEVRAS